MTAPEGCGCESYPHTCHPARSVKFPLFVHWPDYTDEQQCYIRQDVADGLFEALEEARLIVANLQHDESLFLAKIGAALAKARGEQS